TTEALIAAHHNELAAVIVEPYQRVIVPEPGFLKGLRAVTARYEVPLVFDEIVTGFRLAYGGAQAYYDVVPDVAAFGKVLAGGFPLAAVAGRAAIMHHVDAALEGSPDYVWQAGTLNGNPVAAVAGLATLAELRKPGTYERLFATGKRLRDGLAAAARKHGLPAQVSGEPPVFDIIFTDRPAVDYRATLTADRRRPAEGARPGAQTRRHAVVADVGSAALRSVPDDLLQDPHRAELHPQPPAQAQGGSPGRSRHLPGRGGPRRVVDAAQRHHLR